MNKSYSAILVDWDDTLWDFQANAYVALQKAYDIHNLQRYFDSFNHFYALYETRNKQLWQDYSQNKITKNELQRERFIYPFEMVGHVDSHLSETVGNDFLELTILQNKLLPDATPLIQYLAQKYTLVILSNGFKEVQYRKIEASGLKPYIKHIVLSEEVGAQKPDRQIFEYALKLLRLNPTQVLMIGDNLETDIKGAMNMGIDTIYLAQTLKKDAVEPTYHVKTLKEIMNII